MKTIIISNSVELAKNAKPWGVDAVMVDLESEGKVERQKSRNTFISTHNWDDILAVSESLSEGADLIVRINPYSERTKGELEKLKTASVSYIMLPMIKNLEHVTGLIRDMQEVGINAKVLPLIEHIEGLEALEEILDNVPEIKRVFFGLNDMSLSLKLPFLFQCLTEGYVEKGAAVCKARGIEFGFGGVGRVGSDTLVAPELILSEHARLGSNSVILSRAFCSGFEFLEAVEGKASPSDAELFVTEVTKVKKTYEGLKIKPDEDLSRSHAELADIVSEIISR